MRESLFVGRPCAGHGATMARSPRKRELGNARRIRARAVAAGLVALIILACGPPRPPGAPSPPPTTPPPTNPPPTTPSPSPPPITNPPTPPTTPPPPSPPPTKPPA